MKKTVLIIIAMFLTTALFSQGDFYQKREKQTSETKNKQFDISKLEFGGGLGLSFGNHSTSIAITPEVGYRFNKYVSAGAGLGYSYYNWDSVVSQHYANFGLYGRFYPIDFLVFSVRPEINRVWGNESLDGGDYNYTKFFPSVVVGGGVRFGGVTLQINYDLVQDKYSQYGNRIFYSVGYTFGL